MECSVYDGESNERETTTGMPTAGRYKFDISRDQLVHLIEHNFTAVSIAKMFDISLSMVRRRMQEQGLSSSQPFSSLTEELDSIVRGIKSSYPKCGYRMLIGHLRGPLSKIHPSVFGRKNKFSSYFVYELDFGQY